MPAIHLDRLEQQLNQVFTTGIPGEVFRQNFLSLVEAHANLAYQEGKDIQRKSLIPKLQLPPILMHRIQLRLISIAKTNPNLAIEYAEQLWTINFYETKLLSSIILGNLPESSTQLVVQKFLDFGLSANDFEIHQILLLNGSKNIRQTSQNKWLEIIYSWIDSNQTSHIILAISAVRALVQEPSFINLPRIFKIITPLFSIENRRVTSALLMLMTDLVEKNSNETAYFLSSTMLSGAPKITAQFIRKILKLFPPKERQILRDSLSNAYDDN